MNISKETKFLIWVAKQASKLIDVQVEVSQKNGLDLVTENDLKLEKFISAEMRKKFPDFTIIGEEFSNDADKTLNYFVIDPIDGTINYAMGLEVWGIQIGCVKNGEPFASVIMLPATNELYFAEKDKGAYKNGKRINVCIGEPKGKIVVSNILRNAEDWAFLEQVMPDEKERFLYSRKLFSDAYTSAKLAEGAIGTFYSFNFKTNIWDGLPGEILITEAGGHCHCDESFKIATAFECEKDRILNLFKKWSTKKDGK